jgi:hypothetical protein
MPSIRSQVVVRQFGIAHDAALRSRLQIFIAMDRHHRAPTCCGVTIDEVAAVDSGQRPALLFKDAAHLLAGNYFHGVAAPASRPQASS